MGQTSRQRLLSAAAAQALFAIIVLRMPTTTVLRAGIAGNLAIIALWIVTRTIGIPLGPHAGEVEAVGRIDVVSKLVELALVVMLAILLRNAPRSTRASMSGAH